MDENEASSVHSVKKCPICGGELERGYVIAYRGFWWDTKKHTYIGAGERLMKYPSLTNTNFPGLRCWTCHIIIFDYEKKE
jgi:hypothetical protein